MHVLICGAGRVGHGIARRLAREKHDITIIDENPDLVDQVSTDLDVRGFTGHAAHPDVLKKAGAADCEMIGDLPNRPHAFFRSIQDRARARAILYRSGVEECLFAGRPPDRYGHFARS